MTGHAARLAAAPSVVRRTLRRCSTPPDALWGGPVVSRAPTRRWIRRASAKLWDPCAGEHSSWNVPSQRCRSPFWMGLPGSMPSHATSCWSSRASRSRPAHWCTRGRGPCCKVFRRGVPCRRMGRSSRRTTTRPCGEGLPLGRRVCARDRTEQARSAAAPLTSEHVLPAIRRSGCAPSPHRGVSPRGVRAPRLRRRRRNARPTRQYGRWTRLRSIAAYPASASRSPPMICSSLT